MKTILAALVALGFATSVAGARPIDSTFTQINQSAPHSVFDNLNASAPRSIFDDIGASAPRSYFDTLGDNAPRSATTSDGVNPNLAGE